MNDWFEEYNSRNPSDTCPCEILTTTCCKEASREYNYQKSN